MLSQITTQLKENGDKAIDHLHHELRGVHTGRASAELVEDLPVDSYGSKMALKAVAAISIPDAKTIQITPWDKGMFTPVEKAINEAPVSLTPHNDGSCIRITMPPLTEERRKEFAKLIKQMLETAKISIRGARQKAMDILKKMEKDGEISEDARKGEEKKVQDVVDNYNKQADEIFSKKDKDIMTI
ncbi:MAG: ribosome recycling factor [Patescibacteria group bacterium]|nr:ribosome recycling factor [Patescibacteria group bacterium]